MQTRSQKMAQQAYEQVHRREVVDGYTSFAKDFPTLVHTCGLAQAIAFAEAKTDDHRRYLDDLAKVLSRVGYGRKGLYARATFAENSREFPVLNYVRLSRDALAAAVWLKRYVEAHKVDQASSDTESTKSQES